MDAIYEREVSEKTAKETAAKAREDREKRIKWESATTRYIVDGAVVEVTLAASTYEIRAGKTIVGGSLVHESAFELVEKWLEKQDLSPQTSTLSTPQATELTGSSNDGNLPVEGK
jgi:hypothetical protein